MLVLAADGGSSVLSSIADFAAIATAAIAAGVTIYYWIDRCQKRLRLERYLKSKKMTSQTEYIHSVIHLMAELGMTEAEILQAAFSSWHIKRSTQVDSKTNLATHVLFEYQ